MKHLSAILFIVVSSLLLQACVHKVVTVPVKIAYKTTKGVVKGTTKVVKAVIPDGKKDQDKDKKDGKDNND